MVSLAYQSDKYCQQEFRPAPWTVDSPEWKTIDEELPRGDAARCLVAAVDQLDLGYLQKSYSAGGSDALPPNLMLKIIVIEFWFGRTRPSQWFEDAQKNIALKWAGFGLSPSRSSWYNFRDRVGIAIEGLFSQTLQIAQQTGLTTATRGALDGTFVSANASRHRLLNSEQIDKRLVELDAACEKDLAGDSSSPLPRWMAKKPDTRARQRNRYRRARERLRGFQATNQRQRSTRRRSVKKIVVSVSEPEAAIGWDKSNVFRPLYNVQILKDLDSTMTLAYDVFAQNNDCGTLRPMIGLVRDRLHLPLSTIVCDANYVTATNLMFCDFQHVTLYGPWKEKNLIPDQYTRTKKQGVIPKSEFTWEPEQRRYRCPEGFILTAIGKCRQVQVDGEVNVVERFRCSAEHCSVCPRRALCTPKSSRGRAVRRNEHEELIEAHRARMAESASREVYRLRKQTIELEYADLKQNRSWRTLSGHGLARAKIEVGLLELTRNLAILQKLIKAHQRSGESREIPVNDTS